MLKNKTLIYLILLSSLFGAKYLAVLDLEAEGLSVSEAKILTQRLTSKIIELGSYTVVERANIDKILAEMKFQTTSGCVDSECAVEIGQMAGAEVTVIGTVSKFGKTYTIDSRIIDVESGAALYSASYTHTGEIDELVKEGIESIAHKLLGIPYKKKISTGATSKASSGYGATLDINSDPPGAEIYIGNNYFDTTPLILEDFPAGDYEVELRLEGYENYNKSVKLLPRGSAIINASLYVIPSYISFSGTPSASEVHIDINGKRQYGTNNRQNIEVSAGTHTIRVSKDNYLEHLDTVTVIRGKTERVSYDLKKNVGYLKVDVNPGAATVYVDGYLKSKETELTPGTYTLKVLHDGHDEYTSEVEIKLDEITELDIELNRQYGHLDLKLSPYNAKVYFNDSLAMELELPSSIVFDNNTLEFKLATGIYDVRAEKPYYYSKSMMATIKNKERTGLTFSLKSGDEDLNKLRKNRKLGYIVSGIIATAFAVEYLLGESSYQSYVDATDATDAKSYRDKSEMYTALQTPTAALLGASAGFTLYTTISLESLKKKLSLK